MFTRWLLCTLLLAAGVARADAPPADPRAAWLKEKKIALTESRDFTNTPEWLQQGSKLGEGAKAKKMFGVGMVHKKVSTRWQDQLLACRLRAMGEVQQVFEAYTKQLLKDYAQATSETISSDTAGASRGFTQHQWGNPPFKLTQLSKSYSDTSDKAASSTFVSTAIKLELPPAVWGGKALKYYEEASTTTGKPPQEQLNFTPGIPDVPVEKLNEVEAYFTNQGWQLSAVHQLPDDIACLVTFSLDAAK